MFLATSGFSVMLRTGNDYDKVLNISFLAFRLLPIYFRFLRDSEGGFPVESFQKVHEIFAVEICNVCHWVIGGFGRIKVEWVSVCAKKRYAQFWEYSWRSLGVNPINCL